MEQFKGSMDKPQQKEKIQKDIHLSFGYIMKPNGSKITMHTVFLI